MTDHATLLKENDLKATFQRMSILESIESHGHMAIDAIYEEVVKTFQGTLEKQSGLAKVWSKLNIGRKVIKPIVMTIPYDKTAYSCIDDLKNTYWDFFPKDFTAKKRWDAAEWLYKRIWEIITEKIPNITADFTFKNL